MDTKTRPTVREGHEVCFDPGELTLITLRNNEALQGAYEAMMSGKVSDIVLRYHSGVDSKHLQMTRLSVREGPPKHWGTLIEIFYKIKGKPGSYRHVFHFMLDNGGLGGRFFTQTRRYIAK